MLNIYIKGILLGIANIIPGVSGGTLALILKIYYKIINSISEILKLTEIKKNLMFFNHFGNRNVNLNIISCKNIQSLCL